MPSNSTHSISRWIASLKAGESEAVQQLWNRYVVDLVRLARQRIAGLSQRASDEEDIAQSVFMSLCHGAEAGRFSDVRNRDELWWLLVAITKQKTIDLARREMAKKRGSGRVQPESSISINPSSSAPFSLDQLVGEQPTPEVIAIMDEENRRLLSILRDDQLRRIAILRVEGYTVKEVASRLEMTSRSVERKLNLIRNAWAMELNRAQAEPL